MNRKTLLISLLLFVVLLAGIPESFARQQYLSSLITVYGDGSCGTCHVRASGGGERNSYGTLFENQANHAADPGAALKAIGQPPTATATNPAATATLTATSSMTPGITEEIPDEEETQEEIETPTETAAPAITYVTVTPAAAGFGIVVSLAGLFVCALLVKRSKK